MKRKSHLLIALSAALLLLDVGAAGAQGRGEFRNKGEQQGNSERGGPGSGRGAENRGGGDGGRREAPLAGAPSSGGGDRGGDRAARLRENTPQQQQRQGGQNGGQPNGWQNRMREQAQGQNQQRQQRPDWANGGQGGPRGGDQNGWQNRMRQQPQQTQPQVQPRRDFSNEARRDFQDNGRDRRYGDQQTSRSNANNGPNYRNDGRNNGPAFSGFRREPNSAPRYDTRFGQRYDYRRDNWAGRNDWARYDRRNRSQITVNIGAFFGPSYGTIASRYYGRNYIYYSSHRWSSWNRPWRIGYVLPPTIFCEPLPYDLYFDLPPPPWGYDYALCGGDILMIGTDTGVIYDAILPY